MPAPKIIQHSQPLLFDGTFALCSSIGFLNQHLPGWEKGETVFSLLDAQWATISTMIQGSMVYIVAERQPSWRRDDVFGGVKASPSAPADLVAALKGIDP